MTKGGLYAENRSIQRLCDRAWIARGVFGFHSHCHTCARADNSRYSHSNNCCLDHNCNGRTDECSYEHAASHGVEFACFLADRVHL